MDPGADRRTVRNARRLRRELTEPERRLWVRLRAGLLEGAKFRRQHPIGRYVLDFYCDAAKLAVEIDGDTHAMRTGQDEFRTRWLAEMGIDVLRFTNRDVIDNIDGVLETLVRALRARPHRLAPLATLSPGERVQQLGEP